MVILAHTTCYFVFPQTQILKGRLECKWFIWCKGSLGGWGREEVKKGKPPEGACVSGPLMWGHRAQSPGAPAVSVQNVPEFSQLRAENLGCFPTNAYQLPWGVNSLAPLDRLECILPWPEESIRRATIRKSLVEGENLTGLFRASTIFVTSRGECQTLQRWKGTTDSTLMEFLVKWVNLGIKRFTM